MTSYLVRRVLQAIPLLFLISIIIFGILELQPEKPWDALLFRPNLSAAARQHILDYFAADRPPWERYLKWLSNLAHGDFGFSYFSHTNTIDLIRERLPNTVILMGTSYVFTLLIAVPIGIIAAVKQYSKFDSAVTTGAFLGFSLPNFWLGLMLIILLAVYPTEHFGYRIFPTGGMTESGEIGFATIWTHPIDLAWHLVLPSIVLAVQGIATYSRYIRGSMLEVLNQDFIRTARAKGLSNRTVVLRHAFRNALLPLITLMGLEIPRLFVGALITEQVFKWPGMGRLFWESAQRSDTQVLLGILVLLALLVVLGNLIADLAYGWADPRIQYR